MQNTAYEVNTWLSSQLPDLPAVYNDVFPTPEGDAIVCRHDPSQAVERRFCDRSRYVKEQFSYHARSKNAANCRKYLDDIIEKLDTQELIRVSDSVSVQCEAVTLPQFVQTDDKNNTVYTAVIQVEYTEQAPTSEGEL